MVVEVKVEPNASRAYHFNNDITPLLNRFGCNSSGCHGHAEGQNGFKLSVFGFDPAGDYDALTKQGRGRRILPASPEHSLLLAKPTMAVPHKGGLRFPVDSPAYKILADPAGKKVLQELESKYYAASGRPKAAKA